MFKVYNWTFLGSMMGSYILANLAFAVLRIQNTRLYSRGQTSNCSLTSHKGLCCNHPFSRSQGWPRANLTQLHILTIRAGAQRAPVLIVAAYATAPAMRIRARMQ